MQRLMILVCSIAAVAAHGLEAGFSTADITPDVDAFDVPMAGYGAREGKPSTGIRDRLLAKVMVLKDGDSRIALVTADLRSVTPELKGAILYAIESPGFTEANLLLAASHNHSGPSIFPEPFWQAQFGEYDPAIIPPMAEAIARAVDEAVAGLAPARIGLGQTMAEGFTSNRRWGYDTEAREEAGETPCVDPELTVIRIDDEAGEIQGLLVHFATHPTILSHRNMQLSGEWPGVLQRSLEDAYPGAAVLYANGAEGDQSPSGAKGEDEFAKVVDYGTRLAAKAQAVVDTIETEGGADVGYAHNRPELPELRFSPGAKSGPYAYMEPMARKALPNAADMQALRLGAIGLVSVPGEPICEVGNVAEDAIREAGYEHALIISLANDYIGYVVNEKEYAHGGYEVDARSYYGPGLGDWVAEHAGKVAKEALTD